MVNLSPLLVFERRQVLQHACSHDARSFALDVLGEVALAYCSKISCANDGKTSEGCSPCTPALTATLLVFEVSCISHIH